jgi:hypothetical protein
LRGPTSSGEGACGASVLARSFTKSLVDPNSSHEPQHRFFFRELHYEDSVRGTVTRRPYTHITPYRGGHNWATHVYRHPEVLFGSGKIVRRSGNVGPQVLGESGGDLSVAEPKLPEQRLTPGRLHSQRWCPSDHQRSQPRPRVGGNGLPQRRVGKAMWHLLRKRDLRQRDARYLSGSGHL